MFDLEHYNYHLPKELLASEPAKPRDNARLFVYNTQIDEIFFDRFINLDKYLPEKSFIVFNNTKVLPARIFLHKEKVFYQSSSLSGLRSRGGGKVEVLLLINEWRDGDKMIKGMVDRKIEIGQKLYFSSKYWLEVKKQDNNIFYFVPNFAVTKLKKILEKYGKTPIPRYLKGVNLNESKLRERYQSIFAKRAGSIAAPTASLHFTPRVLKKISKKGIKHTFVTLNVGMGTFSPLSENNFKTNKLHTEWIEISKTSANKINKAILSGYNVVAVGTTTTRTLESAATKKLGDQYFLSEMRGGINTFIYPPYHFKLVDTLITNFHLPKSSLMLLVDAFLKNKKAKRDILNLYQIAIQEKFRFYSFGDAMLLL
jgi:S-adenosylmethionine:tRNA ribosyltransferase-isomerase